LLAREALLRLRFDAADFVRAAPLAALLFEGDVFEPELLDAVFLGVVALLCALRAFDCPPREPDLLAAILIPPCSRIGRSPLEYPPFGGGNRKPDAATGLESEVRVPEAR
jgi:hypothetical protein